MNLFKHRHLTADALTGLGLDAAFVHPMLEPGDVLAFSNYTIHETSVRPGMNRPRTNIEVRVLLLDKT